jgi:uncharacterized protein YecT (DUF1311 family)
MFCCLLGAIAPTPLSAETARTRQAETIGMSQFIGVAPPVCEADTQLALNLCAVRWARTADFLRSLLYEQIYQRLTEEQRSQLDTTEQAWNTFRDAHCLELAEPFREGSIYPLLYHSCRARTSNDRTADLQGLGNPEVSEETLERVEPLLNEVRFRVSNAQRSWNRYQRLHCEFERTRTAESLPLEQCQQRLFAARMRQIEDMARIR